jgi:hypothetical protein
MSEQLICAIGLGLFLVIICGLFIYGLISKEKQDHPYYVISLEWSQWSPGGYFMFYRANDSGFTECIDFAGIYTQKVIDENREKYNNGVDSLAIAVDKIDHYFKAHTRYEIHSGSLDKLRALAVADGDLAKALKADKLKDERYAKRRLQLIDMGFEYEIWDELFYRSDISWFFPVDGVRNIDDQEWDETIKEVEQALILPTE